ncbi:MAG: AAA family ATPase [Deltaproteobacteria bacterium]|nr:AAA family ATPase [Deltaproteobacteria bacterium]
MYENYFGLVDLPFRATTELHYLYRSPSHRTAFANLQEGVNARKGLLVVIGEIGTGKTTLLTAFMQSRADSDLQTALVVNPSFTFTELLRFILEDLGIPPSSDDKTVLLEQIADYASQKARNGHNVALFIDEAQTLKNDVLDELRLLSESQTGDDKLIQIVLLGQPELDQKLDQPELRQLKQQVKVHTELAPLSHDEVRYYIDFRLARAGYHGKPLFESKAIEKITFYSSGIPRLVNIICDNALLNAYALSKHKVSAEIIDEVADDLQLGTLPELQQTAPVAQSHSLQDRSDTTRTEMQPGAFFVAERLAGRPASTIVAGLGLGILLALGLLLSSSSAFYHQGSTFLTRMPPDEGAVFTAPRNEPAHNQPLPQADIDNPDDYRLEINRILMKKEAGDSIPPTPPKLKVENSSDHAQATAPRARPLRENESTPDTTKSQPAEPPNGNSHRTNVQKPSNEQLIVNKPDGTQPQTAKPPAYWPNDKPARKEPRETDRQQYFYQGTFEVTADSFLFDQPRRESALLKTLRPGIQVQVEKKVGNFLIVRSVQDPPVQGYVHLEDAFFKRIGR